MKTTKIEHDLKMKRFQIVVDHRVDSYTNVKCKLQDELHMALERLKLQSRISGSERELFDNLGMGQRDE